jgi:hypothetical protein
LPHQNTLSAQQLTDIARSIGDDKLVVEEVVEVIDMPDFVAAGNASEVELSDEVVEQLRDFVTQIAARYNDNPCKDVSAYLSYHSPSPRKPLTPFRSIFHAVHNFEHVSDRPLKYRNWYE